MKIELKIDDKNIELQQKNTEIIQNEDQTATKYNVVPYVFYYTNCLNFEVDDDEGDFYCVKFFNKAVGCSIKFQNKIICLYESLTNMHEAQSFCNRYDVYHVAWEIVGQKSYDLTQKQKIIEYLMCNCCFKIYTNNRVTIYPFTDLSNKLYINTGSFNRIEAREEFIIKLKMTGDKPPQDLLKLLPDTILKIYLHGNYWLEKRE